MSRFKSLVSTSLFMSLFFIPNMASADANGANMQGQRANNYQGSNNQQQYANDDQDDDDENGDHPLNGGQSPYSYQDGNQDQRAAYNSGSANQWNEGWRDKWDRHYGSTAKNTQYYSSSPNYSSSSNYSTTPNYDNGHSNYVSSPTHYDSNGYPTYQSYPADGYYYNAGYTNSNATQYNANGYPTYRTYPADGYYYNTNRSNSYPYSQDYRQGSGVGAGVYFNVR